MTKALVFRKASTARRVLRSLRLLGDARLEYPWLRPSEFFIAGTYPSHPKPTFPRLYALVLHPGKAWYAASPRNRPQDVALAAAGLLEERHAAVLDWAAGFRASGAVWLFVKPWACDRETGERVWFRPTREDLATLRGLFPSPKRERPGRPQKVGPKGRAAERERR